MSIRLKLLGRAALLPLLAFLTCHSQSASAQNSVITYQGRVVDQGTNFSGVGQFKFALVTSTNFNHQATAAANPPSGGFITVIDVTDGGSGYVTAPSVTIIGGGGSNATAHASINGGAVTGVTVDNPGSHYTSTPTVLVDPPPPNIVYTTYWSNDGTSVAGSEPGLAVSVSVNNGLFMAALGDVTQPGMSAIDASLFTRPNLQLRIWFNDGVNGFAALDPAQNLTATPYSMNALGASNLLGTVAAAQLTGSIGSDNLAGTYGNTVTFGNSANSFNGNGAGLTTLNASQLTSGTVPDARLGTTVARTDQVWLLNGNSGTSPTNGNFLGTADNQPLDFRVNQSRALRLEPDTNNFGAPNVIGGAPNNFVDPGIVGATIAGGGVLNYINGYEPGPGSNHVSAVWGTIGGGRRNTVAADHSSIGGGHDNLIQARAYNSVVPGGEFNTIQSNAYDAVIGGGYTNTAIGDYTTVSGGYENTALGNYSTVAGGYRNSAQGDYSFAAGDGAVAKSQGTFVWSDSQGGTVSINRANSVFFRCGGGVSFSGGSFASNQTISWSPGDASWSFSSDRNLKEKFHAVDTQAVLEKVVRLPLLEWKYKNFPQRHIGAMAQDFHALFPLNENDKVLNDADLHGVELAAIQGLDQKLDEKDSEIQQQAAEISDLKARLEKLEAIIQGNKGNSK